MPLNFASLERIVPGVLDSDGATGQATLNLHLARYEFAARHLRSGSLLDAACGVGYGTKLLTSSASGITSAIGIDISDAAVEYARTHYGDPRARFIATDALAFSHTPGFDNIVSLETIEHIPNPRQFLAHLVGLLKPEGILVGSVPVTPSVDANPHHLNDFTQKSFRAMGRRLGLIEQGCLLQSQPYSAIAILRRKEARSGGIRQKLPQYYLTHPRSFWARLYSTVRYGFQNRYLTIVWQKPAGTALAERASRC